MSTNAQGVARVEHARSTTALAEFSRSLTPRTRTAVLGVAHVVVGALVVFVATWNIGVADAAPDEYVYRSCAHSYAIGTFTCNLEHPLLVKEIMGVFEVLFGSSIDTARLVTAFFAVATAVFCYLFVTDCTDRVGGLIAAAAWGLLPQAGVEGGTTIEAVRIDRFGLLDPFVACFVALALWAGWRWTKRGGIGWAAIAGGACVAAACSKVPGALAAPVICLVPIVARRRERAVRGECMALCGAGVAVFVASYGPLGPSQAASAIAYMFRAQTSHVNGGSLVAVAGHLYIHPPWWSDIAFAISGLTIPIALLLVVGCVVGLVVQPRPVGYVLAVAASVVIGVGVGLHLSLPHYWIDWEPGVIVAASIGLRRLNSASWTLPVGVVALVILGIGAWRSISGVATIKQGPYKDIGVAASCVKPCAVEFAGYNDILINYVSPNDRISLGPPRVRHGAVEAPFGHGTTLVRAQPQVIVIDPAALSLHSRWTEVAQYFETRATHFGYRQIPTKGRIKVWILTHQ